ncbi:hypothetical protein LDO26_00945 [Luteimonas sp. BDR2-5]|uniref:hypothetical protein n=1 Tax=Proluteimonas luteida TaxID=2878685 RepID=UPI001E2CD919|nr:hypothetical protein [Luteimonas sp. BDR2-5]MCD9026782.1 hypothetical protein [Luteimonas sp. BDR2-5]
MAYCTSSQHLQALVDALARPAPPGSRGAIAAKQTRRIVEQGWATSAAIEDLLLLMDRRLDPYGAGSVDVLSALFDLPWRSVAYRPSRLAIDVVLHQAMAASDVAQLLIHLEACGFAVDPAPMVDALMPGLRQRQMLDASELSILWFERWRHKATPMAIRADNRAVPAELRKRGTTPSGYRIETWHCIDGNLVELRIRAPRYRRRKPPVETKCSVCGWTWFRGDPESSQIHRREHKARMRYIDPQPHPRVLSALERGEAPSWVTSTSPPWKHREMYDRALAFKREFGYSFVQWGSELGDDDPNVQGFLFLDARAAIIGACAFRLRGDAPSQWWGLQWIWLSPKHRRNGHLGRQWERFKARFGRFEVESPLSEAMAGFLAKQGDSRLAGELFAAQAASTLPHDVPRFTEG